MFGKKKPVKLSREEEDKLFALRDMIYKEKWPTRPLPIRHPLYGVKGIGDDLSDDEIEIISVQNEIKKLLGIE